MVFRVFVMAIAVAAPYAEGQGNLHISDPSAKEETLDRTSTSGAAKVDAVSVSKTAFVDAAAVCGTVRIRNDSARRVIPTGIADSLEVHFPRGVTPALLPRGSTREWFKVADVPLALPGPIAPGDIVRIDYCFPLCLAADYAGASMRNVVTVRAADAAGGSKSFTTRLLSFPPPSPDCQAHGGEPLAPGTDCGFGPLSPCSVISP